jgi:glycosyltransferase involved in cell wall biosynthesis
MHSDIETLHITESLSRLGGVESLIHQILENDPKSHSASLLDTPDLSITRCSGLRRGKLCGAHYVKASARKRYHHAKYLVFHNFAGLTMLAPIIPHERKILFLHTNSVDVFRLLPSRLPFLDAIIASGDSLKLQIVEAVQNTEIPIFAIEYPIDEGFFSCESKRNESLKIGYAGRLENEQKCALRIIEFHKQVVSLKISCNLEIAGTGSVGEQLKRSLPADRHSFLGRLDNETIKKAYRDWDFLICTSDYETGPLVVMEAMAAGVVPIMPNIPCQATKLLSMIGVPLYPPGDMHAAAVLLGSLSSHPNLHGIRSQVREVVSDRSVSGFVGRLGEILGETMSHPPRGKTPEILSGISEIMPFAFRKSSNAFLR